MNIFIFAVGGVAVASVLGLGIYYLFTEVRWQASGKRRQTRKGSSE